MTLRYYTNSATTTLAAAATSTATTVTVSSATGFPIQYPFTIIIDKGTDSEEVALVTGASGNTFTVTRGYDSTPNYAHAVGTSVVQGISAIDPREANAHVNATTNIHGVGTPVGTSEAQTLTNKTIPIGTNTINGFGNNKVPVSDSTGRLGSGSKDAPAGGFVGTTDAQTLTNKNLTDASNTFPATLVDLNSFQSLNNKILNNPIIFSGTPYMAADTNPSLVITSSNTAITGLSGSVSASSAGNVYFVTAGCYAVWGGSATGCYFGLLVDGVPFGGESYNYNNGSGDARWLSQNWIVSLGSGSHTFQPYARTSSSGINVIAAANASLRAFRIL